MTSADLSNFHEPVLVSFCDGKGHEPDGLSREQIDYFHENGFVSAIPVLSDRQLGVLRDELALLMDPSLPPNALFYEIHHNESSDPETVLFHALGAWRISPGFHDLVFLRRIVKIAGQLLGGPVRLWHDQLFVKPPRDGAVVEWHQDYSYWTRTKPVAHLTCWIGLDDSTEDNGCLRYIRGSHKWDLLPRYHLSGSMSSVFEYLSDEQRAAFDPVPALLRAGEASFHHPLMMHGSYENTSNRMRRAAVVNFLRDGVISDSDQPLLEGVPVIPPGSKIEGQFFPLLSQESF